MSTLYLVDLEAVESLKKPQRIYKKTTKQQIPDA